MNTKLVQLMALDLARSLLALEPEMSSEELDDIYQRFLMLDADKMPEPGAPPFDQVAPKVQKGYIIFTLSRINYRSTRNSLQLHLSWGKPLCDGDADEMLMWLSEYEEQEAR